METTIPQPQQADNSAESYLQEAAIAPQPASIEDAGLNDIPSPGNSPTPPPEPQPVYTPPADAAPIYTPPAADTAAPAAQPKLSSDHKRNVVRSYLLAEDMLSSRINAAIAGQLADDTPFRASDADIDMLLVLLEPYYDLICEKLPGWLPVLLVYVNMKSQQVIKAIALRKVNKSNEEGRQDEGNIDAVRRTIPLSGNRSNFTIYVDGYYAKDRKGNYIKDRGNNRRLLEKPDIQDLDNILAVKANRSRDLLRKAFGWTEAEFEQYKIPE